MRHSMILKFLAILLASVALVTAVGCAAGIVQLENAGLYISGLDALQDQAYATISKEIATRYANLYAVENLGSLPYTLKEDMYEDPMDRSDAEHWFIRLYQDGVLLSEKGKTSGKVAYTKEFTIAPLYVMASLTSPDELNTKPTQQPDPEATEFGAESADLPRNSVIPDTQVSQDYLYSSQETALQGGKLITYYLYYYQAPEYTVKVFLREEVLHSSSLHLLTDIYTYRYSFIGILAASLLLCAVCVVYLINAAGVCADGSIRPTALNRIPLDLYALAAGGAEVALIVLFFRLYDWMEYEGPHMGNLSLMGVNLLAVAVIAIAFCFAFAAQVKVKNGFWWRNSLIGWVAGRTIALLRLIAGALRTVAHFLPVMWQWLLTAGIMVLSVVVLGLLALNSKLFAVLLMLDIFVCGLVVVYGGWCFGVLMQGARRMSLGDLDTKVETRYLLGNFKECALQLNALSETARIAARKQMQSERMKSELITNVSHDIKTPLTSIINFVDLLRKPHTDAQQQEYLEVLSRQSSQMKKLIEDLMELSKASSGNITVNLQTMDASETVNQALGEFADKLEAAKLTPVFRQPEQQMVITADGRLTWRVLNNLLVNAVKYALPGTRLYVDLVQVEDRVLLSLKNVSREPLTVEAEELLERFVRGDASRHSEGSGLGLNIAKNLMEVQGGKLQLLLDGDLFKVMLVFPAAE